MAHLRFGWLLVCALAVLCAPGVRAESQKIGVKLEKVTCQEAMTALSNASGVALQLFPPRPDPNDEGASFDWTNVTFARALRQLCERYGLRPDRDFEGGYRLMRGVFPGGAAPRPAKPAHLVEKAGVRLYPTTINLSEDRQRQLDLQAGGLNVNDRSSLSVTLRCELGDVVDADQIVGFENVVARDDLGNVIWADQNLRFASLMSNRGTFPDEWEGPVRLPGPHPRAKKLEWLEGELHVWSVHRRHRVEIPLPRAEGSARREVLDASVELTRLTPPPEGDPVRGPTVEVIVFVPADSPLRSERGFPVDLSMVGASGRVYRPHGRGSSGRGDEGGIRYSVKGDFGPIDEALTKVLVSFVERRDPERLLTFRMQNLSLPELGPFAPPAVPPAGPGGLRGRVIMGAGRPLPPRPGAAADRPYHQEGGGILVTPVRIQGKPAISGRVALGLSRKEGEGWSPVRWVDASVADGVARLVDLQPGIYRVLRAYRTEMPLPAGAGRWEGSEAQVEIAAGKEAVTPLLAWTEGAAAPPAPRRR